MPDPRAATVMDRLGLQGQIERWVRTGCGEPLWLKEASRWSLCDARWRHGGIDHVEMLRCGRTVSGCWAVQRRMVALHECGAWRARRRSAKNRQLEAVLARTLARCLWGLYAQARLGTSRGGTVDLDFFDLEVVTACTRGGASWATAQGAGLSPEAGCTRTITRAVLAARFRERLRALGA